MSDAMQTLSMTQSGYDALVQEFEELKNIKLPAAVTRLSTARSYGDLSENAEYHAAKEDLAMLEGRIEELEILIHRAEVIKPNPSLNGMVSVGSAVVVQIEGKDGTHLFQIVGEWEADPTKKKISEKSPLGVALLGKKAGEKIDVAVPAGKVIYHIQEVKAAA